MAEKNDLNAEDLKPSEKKRRLSLSLRKRPRSENRFASPTKPELLEKAAKGVVLLNTHHSTTWLVKEESNGRVQGEQIEDNILFCTDCKRLSYILRLFVLEVRKSNGDSYPPNSLRNILSGINRKLVSNGVHVKILDKSDNRFRELHLTLDSICSELHRSGLGLKKSAQVITIEVEDMLWEKGILGFSNPKVLQNTGFFMLDCILCCVVYRSITI